MEIDDEAQAMHEESEEVGNVEQNEDLQLYVEKAWVNLYYSHRALCVLTFR